MPNLASGLQWAETAVMYRRKSSLAGKVYLVKKSHLKTAFSRRQKSASPQFGRTWMPNCCSTFSKQDIWDFMNLCNMHTQICVTISKWLYFLYPTIFPLKPIRPTFMQVLNLAQLYWSRFCYGFGFGFGSIPLVEPFDCVWLLRGWCALGELAGAAGCSDSWLADRRSSFRLPWVALIRSIHNKNNINHLNCRDIKQ